MTSRLSEIFEKVYKSKYINIMMGILFVCEIIIMFLFSQYWILVPSRIFKISAELICMTVLMVFYILHFNKINLDRKSEKLFAGLCLLLFICIYIDVISCIVDGSFSYAWLNAFSKGSVYILEFIYGALFCEYIFESFENNSNVSRTRNVIRKINSIVFLVRLVMVFCGVYFYIDDSGSCVSTNISILSFFYMPVVTIFVCGIASGSNIKFSKLATFLSNPLSTLAMAGIAFANTDYANSMLSLTLSVILIYCSMFADTHQANVGLNESFQTYISDSVLNGDGSKTITCHASLLFCNLHGFTLDMEAMEPEDGIILLNNFYNRMLEVIEANEGRLLEYPGYGLFAIFNQSGHVENAVNAALGLLDKMEELNQYNFKYHYPKLKIGIGINTGDVILGNVGSHDHMRYSAIGSNVNLASRIEAYSNDGEITITEYTYNLYKELKGENTTGVESSLIGQFILKGLASPISIYKINR